LEADEKKEEQLLEEMSLNEKVGQMVQISVSKILKKRKAIFLLIITST
jgi:hypothetical protein